MSWGVLDRNDSLLFSGWAAHGGARRSHEGNGRIFHSEFKRHLQRRIASGKQPHSYGKLPCLMGKLTISMAIFNSYVCLWEGIAHDSWFMSSFADSLAATAKQCQSTNQQVTDYNCRVAARCMLWAVLAYLPSAGSWCQNPRRVGKKQPQVCGRFVATRMQNAQTNPVDD